MENCDHEILITVLTDPIKIDLINKVFEAYDNLVYVSTKEADYGLIELRFFSRREKDIRRILATLPFPVKVLTE